MALTFADIEIGGTITLQDFGGQQAVVSYNLVTVDEAQALLDIQAIANALKAITGLQIVRVSVSVAYTTIGDNATGITNPAAAFGAEREHYSVFDVVLSNGRKTQLLVPGPVQAILNTATPDYIEVANAAVQTYLDIFRTTGDNLATIGIESIVGDPNSAYTRHKESRTKTERKKLG